MSEYITLLETRDELFVFIKELEQKRLESDTILSNRLGELYKIYYKICNDIEYIESLMDYYPEYNN